MSGKIITDANLITPSYCTSASPDYGPVSWFAVFFCPLKIVHTFNPDPEPAITSSDHKCALLDLELKREYRSDNTWLFTACECTDVRHPKARMWFFQIGFTHNTSTWYCERHFLDFWNYIKIKTNYGIRKFVYSRHTMLAV